MACLGGIIEASLVSLFEWKPFKRSYRISKPDFTVMCVTAFTTAFVNIEVRRHGRSVLARTVVPSRQN